MKDIKDWTQLLFLIIVNLVFLLFLFNKIFHFDQDVWIGVITSLSSLLAGAFTLLGVKWTLDNQAKKDRYDRLPKDIVNAWKVYKVLCFGGGLSMSKGSDDDLVIKVQNFYDEYEDRTTELSTSVSPEAYRIVNKYFTLIDDYFSYQAKGKMDEWFEKTNRLQDEMAKIVDSLEKEYEKLKKI
ncbi:hypothetical protein [Fictibacillus fluitans]|uniref:Uncharacterized protein n=1 Tax=Fictibacillus fluitans TaxID=3058422 RepID=A0ABT8HX25_9BACL|nr:hypothetical protein [Fictibacillus sp. NE201]MDN4525333.1 hypothetical protein [Fictibacillus sp. NE201]